MWTIVSGIEKNQQAILVVLQTLSGNKRAEKAVSCFTAEELNVDTGLKTVTDKLAAAFQDEKAENAYNSYSKFINCKRNNMSSLFYY